MDTWQIILNITAVVISPIAAVIIAQKLQNRAAKRKDKIDIFKTLVSTNAFGWGNHYRAVEVINSIPVIFADNEKVVNAYMGYVSSCKITKEEATESKRKTIETNSIKLLEEMSKVLGYKSEWHVFTETYMPAGVAEDIARRRQSEDSQLAVGGLAEVALKIFTGQQLPQQSIVEEKKERTNGKTKNAK